MIASAGNSASARLSISHEQLDSLCVLLRRSGDHPPRPGDAVCRGAAVHACWLGQVHETRGKAVNSPIQQSRMMPRQSLILRPQIGGSRQS